MSFRGEKEDLYQKVNKDAESFTAIYNVFFNAATSVKVMKKPTEENPFDDYVLKGKSKKTNAIDLELKVSFEESKGLEYVIDIKGDQRSIVHPGKFESRETGNAEVKYVSGKNPKGFDRDKIEPETSTWKSKRVLDVQDEILNGLFDYSFGELFGNNTSLYGSATDESATHKLVRKFNDNTKFTEKLGKENSTPKRNVKTNILKFGKYYSENYES